MRSHWEFENLSYYIIMGISRFMFKPGSFKEKFKKNDEKPQFTPPPISLQAMPPYVYQQVTRPDIQGHWTYLSYALPMAIYIEADFLACSTSKRIIFISNN